MRQSTPDTTHGILHPAEGLTHFSLTRVPPGKSLAPYVDWHWIVRWDLRERPAYKQETLPYPCANMVFEAHMSAVHGVGLRRFVATLEGRGQVIATKFAPGGLSALTAYEQRALVGAHAPLHEVFALSEAEAQALACAVMQTADIGRVEALLTRALPDAPDAGALEATRLARLIYAEPALVSVEALAQRASMTTRTIQRLFMRHIGVGPKWVIQRARAQEVAERITSGQRMDWAALAQELGFHDQAHLIRVFKAQTGRTPTEYAAQARQTP